jgi:hypothetical protein
MRIILYSLTLGNDFKKNSPLSFFKKFIVETGPNKDKFDKTRALMPLIDGAVIYAKSWY